MKRPPSLLRRLPFLVLVALGVWLWRSGKLFPQDRELVWELGSTREQTRALEIQLYDSDGSLLKRDSWAFPSDGVPGQVVQKLPLREGDYGARVFQTSADGGTRVLEPAVTVSDQESIVLRLENTRPRR